MGKQSAPPAPDYAAAANATAAGNLEAARAAANANRVNQVTPNGNLTYTQTPMVDQARFNAATNAWRAGGSQQAGANINGPFNMFGALNHGAEGARGPAPNESDFTNPDSGWTATTTLSPQQQAIADQQNNLNLGLMGTANRGLNYANDVLSKPGVNLSTVADPTMQGISRVNALSPTSQAAVGSVDMSQLPTTGFNPGQSYQDAMMSRLRPQIDRESQQSDAQLANQGIVQGSEAYNNAKTLLNQSHNDLLNNATVQGLGAGLQANNQAYGQQMGNIQNTYNQTTNNANTAFAQQQAANQQGLAQNQQTQTSNQQALADYNSRLQGNQQSFQQQAYNQMQPINVINALRTGSQVQDPSFVNTPNQATTQGPDLLGAAQGTYNAQLGNVNAANAQSAGMFGTLANVGAAGLMPGGFFRR